jgi:hypothetical protein
MRDRPVPLRRYVPPLGPVNHSDGRFIFAISCFSSEVRSSSSTYTILGSHPKHWIKCRLHQPLPLACEGALHQRRIQNPKRQRANICFYQFKAASLMQVNVKPKDNEFLAFFGCQANSGGHSCSLLNEVIHVILRQPDWLTINRTLPLSGSRVASFGEAGPLWCTVHSRRLFVT